MNLKSFILNFKYYASFINQNLLKIYIAPYSHNQILSNLEHIDYAVQWICRAQDAFPDGGVARSYVLVYNNYFRRKGWIPSYPETTGYIIPTVFNVAHLKKSDNLHQRAIRMAEWECDVQMENGAVMGGTVDQVPTPAVFNTGQVIFGWLRAYQETGNEKFLAASERAGKYLIAQQSDDGSWRKNLSNYAIGSLPFYTYNTRTAWALGLLGKTTGQQKYTDGCRRNIEFALNQQTENGWFRANCLYDPERPLLHTIAYCIRGILESGQLLQEDRYIERARLSADAMVGQLKPDGSLPGRLDSHWRPAVQYSCLTGNAQAAIIWGRFFQITGDARYLTYLKRVNSYMNKIQLLQSNHPGIHGGIAGSSPLSGAYGTFEILNWAVKFYIDALLLEEEITKEAGSKSSDEFITG